jgi:hypothetical protein
MIRTESRAKHVFSLLLLASVLAASLLLVVNVASAQTDPGISISQTADPNPTTVGQSIVFKVTVMNNSVPQYVGLKDFLPLDMELISARPSQGTCGKSHPGTNAVECGFGVLPEGGSATVEVIATPSAPGTMTNTVVGGGEHSPEIRDKATITVKPEA